MLRVNHFLSQYGTVKEVLEHLYESLNEPLAPNLEESERIYQKIGSWFDGGKRLELVKKYENGQLSRSDRFF